MSSSSQRSPRRLARTAVALAASFAVVVPLGAASAPATADGLVPVFDPTTGLAQNVFTARNTWAYDQVWVEVPGIDSDGDGLNDLVHVDVNRPGETSTEGLKVP
ncbi:MAG: hypothetical protein LBT54_05675, partial [Bifidobacteriaceae bacterium]|nr:hypothetical protein [Bifidobacteriaceae bacterium]